MPLAVALVVSAAILFFAWRSRSQYLALPDLPAPPPADPPPHTIIIPARNEAAVIERVVRSLAGSPVLVVDDHSTDATAALAQAAGAEVIQAPALPHRWLGKPHACWTGAQRAATRWLLFVDADTWYEPGFPAALLHYAETQNLSAVSCFPRQVYGSWVERVLMPYAFGLYFTGVCATRVNDPKRPDALANGQCLLIRQDAYQFVGGHKAVAASIIEDVALAGLFKRHRMPARVIRAEAWARVRMYDSFRALRRGFEKNSFRFLQANPFTGVQVIAASIAMTSWLPLLAWLIWDGNLPAAAGFAAVPIVAWRRWYGHWGWACCAPLAIYLFQLVVLVGMLKTLTGLSTDWKGRRVG
jgi:glycosyltransferase involved in cell wall biosynthesis